MSTLELPPLTDDERAAIRELRFVSTSLDRVTAFGITTDGAVAARCPGGATSYPRTREPLVMEWDIRFFHPDAVAIVLELMLERRSLGATSSNPREGEPLNMEAIRDGEAAPSEPEAT